MLQQVFEAAFGGFSGIGFPALQKLRQYLLDLRSGDSDAQLRRSVDRIGALQHGKGKDLQQLGPVVPVLVGVGHVPLEPLFVELGKLTKHFPQVAGQCLLVGEDGAEHGQQQRRLSQFPQAVLQLLQQLLAPVFPQVVAHELAHLGFRQGLHFQLFLQPQLAPQAQLAAGEDGGGAGKIFLEAGHVPPRRLGGQFVQTIQQQQKAALVQPLLQGGLVQVQGCIVFAQEGLDAFQHRDLPVAQFDQDRNWPLALFQGLAGGSQQQADQGGGFARTRSPDQQHVVIGIFANPLQYGQSFSFFFAWLLRIVFFFGNGLHHQAKVKGSRTLRLLRLGLTDGFRQGVKLPPLLVGVNQRSQVGLKVDLCRSRHQIAPADIALMELLLPIPQLGKLLEDNGGGDCAAAQVKGTVSGKFDDAADLLGALIQQRRAAHPRSHLAQVKQN